MNSMKLSKPQAPIDRVFTQTKPAKLKATHHPILPLGDLGNLPVPRPSLRRPANIAG
jgi:hypothetical protein